MRNWRLGGRRPAPAAAPASPPPANIGTSPLEKIPGFLARCTIAVSRQNGEETRSVLMGRIRAEKPDAETLTAFIGLAESVHLLGRMGWFFSMADYVEMAKLRGSTPLFDGPEFSNLLGLAASKEQPLKRLESLYDAVDDDDLRTKVLSRIVKDGQHWSHQPYGESIKRLHEAHAGFANLFLAWANKTNSTASLLLALAEAVKAGITLPTPMLKAAIYQTLLNPGPNPMDRYAFAEFFASKREVPGLTADEKAFGLERFAREQTGDRPFGFLVEHAPDLALP